MHPLHLLEFLEEDAAGNGAEDDEGGLHQWDDEEGVVEGQALREASKPVHAKDAREHELHVKEPIDEAVVRVEGPHEGELEELREELGVHDHLAASEEGRRERERHRLDYTLVWQWPILGASGGVAPPDHVAHRGDREGDDQVGPPCAVRPEAAQRWLGEALALVGPEAHEEGDARDDEDDP